MNNAQALGRFVALANSGEVVPAVAGRRINVLGFIISTLTAANVKFQTGSGADISLTMHTAATGGWVVPANDKGWGITTLPGEPLNLNMNAPTTTGVQVLYELTGG